ncbi:MAG: hypothetical protein AAGB04_00560 [Pseudomonadota bacterium]
MKDIEVAGLTTLKVSQDGTSFRMGVRTREGREAALVFPSESLKSLLIDLFRASDTAFKRQLDDNNVKLVYPIDDFALQAAVEDDRLILTLRTHDGFDASFALEPNTLVVMASMARMHMEATNEDAQTVH